MPLSLIHSIKKLLFEMNTTLQNSFRIVVFIRNLLFLAFILFPGLDGSILKSQVLSEQGTGPISGWSVKTECMPGHIPAFEENRGQYSNEVNNWKVLYACHYEGFTVSFTEQGIIYSAHELHTVKTKGGRNRSEESKEDEEHDVSTELHYLAISWNAANPHPRIEALNPTSFYFCGSDQGNPSVGIDHIPAFRKLVYHDLYPGIDLEFEFHPLHGIKYSLRTKAGSDPSLFTMHYSGQKKLQLDAIGNLEIITSAGLFTDHAPIAETQDGHSVGIRFDKISDNEIRFKLEQKDAGAGLVIDPWLVSPSTGGFVPADIGMDAASNAYVYGMDAIFGFNHTTYLQKYSSAGALLWTYTFSQYPATGASFQSDLAVDPAGNSYVASPYIYTNASGNQYAMVCVSPSGSQSYFYNTYASNNISETWNLAYSCNHATLIQAGCGAGANNTAQVTIMTPSNGNVGQQYANTKVGEVYAGTVGPNGNYYALAADSSGAGASSGPYNNLLCCSVTGTTVSQLYQCHLDYMFRDYTSKSGPNAIGTNGIAAGCGYLYTSDGYSLDQRDLLTGALLKRVTISGGSNGSSGNGGGKGNATDGHVNSGLAVDLACGYVYAGSTGGVYVFDATLNPVGSYASPLVPAAGIVYDVALNNNIVSVCGADASNNGFVAQFPAKTCSSLISIHATNASCGLNNGTATAVPNFCVAPYTYLWNPSGQTTATATGLAPGLYTVFVSTQNSCASVSDTITIINTGSLVPVVTTTPERCSKGNGTATANVTGVPGTLTFSWSTTPVQTGSTATNLSAGTYTLQVTGSSGCSGSKIFTITNVAPGTLNISPHTNVKCNGGNDGSARACLTGGTSPVSYSWFPSGGNTAIASGLSAGLYTVTATDSAGCVSTDTVTIFQPAALVLTTSSTPSGCTGPTGSASVNVTGGTPPYVYLWKPTGGTSPNATGLITGTYSVLVTDANSCSGSATVVVGNTSGIKASIVSTINVTCYGGNNGSITAIVTGGHPIYSYSWSPSGGLAATASGLQAGLYTLTCKDSAGCISIISDTVKQPPMVTVQPMSPTTLCLGQCLTLLCSGGGGTPGYAYSWTISGANAPSPVCPTITTTYTVVATDTLGCISQPEMVVISVYPPLEVIAGRPVQICPGGSANLTCTAGGGNGKYTYSWSPAAGLSSTSISNPVATPTVTTTYTVILTDNCGTTSDSATILVTVFPSPAPIFTANDTVGCAPLCVTFTTIVSPACATATWSFGDGTSGTGCSGVQHCYSAPGSFGVSVSVTDVNGCTGSFKKPNYINTYPFPEAAFMASPPKATVLNPEINFIDQSTGATAWSWSFGDFSGASSVLQNPHYFYPDSGCFTVSLIVTNSYGCTDTAYAPVCVLPLFSFYAPNAFTPNGDGLNDLCMPKGVGIDPSHYHLMLFDRWGNLLFETYTWGQGWDGHANDGSSVAQIDTYIWKVVLQDVFHEKHEYLGHCSIIK